MREHLSFSFAVICCSIFLLSSNYAIWAKKCDSKRFVSFVDGLSLPSTLRNGVREVASTNDKNVLFLEQNDNHYKPSDDVLRSNKFQGFIHGVNSPFALLNSSNDLCRRQSQIYLRELEKLSIWALKMYDSSAKLPSGILNGNVNQFGDFNQCLNVNNEESKIKGQYCLTDIEITLPSNADKKLKYIFDHIHSYSMFRSKLEDVRHCLPRFTLINWGVCTPASCSPEDIEFEMYSVLSRYVDLKKINLRIKVFPDMCQTLKTSYVWTTGSLIATLVFGLLFTTIIVSTVMDKLNMLLDSESNNFSKVLYSFSLKRNIRQLLSVNESLEDIKSVHGIRTLNAIMLLAAHKSITILFISFSNRSEMTKSLSKPWTFFIRASSLYTDTFIFLSGLLTTLSFLRHLNQKGTINLPKEFISRFLRLLPAMCATMLFWMFIMPNLGSGPQWSIMIQQHADICQKTWWRNVLFIHNLFGMKTICLPFTHHVGIDAQLFMMSPLFIWTLWKWPKKSFVALLGLAFVSTGLRYYETFTRKLNMFISFSSSVSQLFDTADYSYSLPFHRLTVYIMGILLAYYLKNIGKNYQLKNNHLRLGWIIAIGFFYGAIIQPSKMGDINYVYSATDAANYASFSPIFWCIFISWIIFVTYTGNEGYVLSLLSWKGFIVCTRLSYTLYLVQFPIYHFNVGVKKHTMEYNFGLFVNIKEAMTIVLASVILTLTVEMPFNNIRYSFVKNSFRSLNSAISPSKDASKQLN